MLKTTTTNKGCYGEQVDNFSPAYFWSLEPTKLVLIFSSMHQVLCLLGMLFLKLSLGLLLKVLCIGLPPQRDPF